MEFAIIAGGLLNKEMLKALFPGTFDPPTLGHLELIGRASRFCDLLVVGIGLNYAKSSPLLTLEEKITVLKKATAHFSNVRVVSFSGLVCEFAKKNEIHILIRGLRSGADLEYETEMALANLALSDKKIETVFLIAEAKRHISSSLIRELAFNGAPLKEFIPEELEHILHTRMQKEK